MLLQLFCTIQIITTSTFSQRVLQDATLSPQLTSSNGASILTNINEVTSPNGIWTVDMNSQSSWQFILLADSSWNFDPIKPSTISLTIITPTPYISTSDLLFGITTNNQQYISMSIPTDSTNRPTKMYPGCYTSQLGSGDIASLPAHNRACDIADHSCNNWRNASPLTSNTQIQSPLTITLENNPMNGILYIYLSSPDYTLPILSKCGYNPLPTGGLKMYISGNDFMMMNQLFMVSNFILKLTIKNPPFNTLPPPPLVPVTTTTTQPPITTTTTIRRPQPIIPTLPNIPGPPAAIILTNPPISSITTTTAPPISSITTPGPGQELGAFGQICASASHTSLCGDPLNDIVHITGGNMPCENEYDCCLCKSISCGINTLNNQNGMSGGCARFSAGDKGAFGVGDIKIYGSDYAGAIIDCFGFEGCSYSIIHATNVGLVQASGDMSLANAQITIDNPLSQFSLDCSGGIGGCAALVIELIIAGPPAGMRCNPDLPVHLIRFGQIKCGTQESCKDMQFTLINNGCYPIAISSLDCIGSDSCTGASFNFVGDVSIARCGIRGAAHGINGIDKCFTNLESLNCPDLESCNNAVRTLTNPVNGFQLNCGTAHSCEGLQLTIDVNGNAFVPIYEFDLFKFSSDSSGAGAVITINNVQGSVELRVKKVECASDKSCENMTIYLGNNVSIGEIICVGNACNGCYIKRTFNEEIIACDSHQIVP